MTIRWNVEVGQVWESNDPRRLARVRVERIMSYETGNDLTRSLCDDPNDAEARGHVHVVNVQTGNRTTIRRDNFTTGVRGWSLVGEAHNGHRS